MGGSLAYGRNVPVFPVLTVLLLSAFALSGCAGRGGGPAAAAAPTVNATFDADTGALHVTILSDEGLPVEGAQAALRELKEAGVQTSNGAGELAFSKLPAGSYHLDVAKLGFTTYSKRIEIQAGDVAKLTVNLESVRVEAPFSRLEILDGMLVCGTGTYVVTQVACGAADSNQKFLHKYQIETEMSGVLWEVTWRSTQALSKDLVFLIERDGCGVSCPASQTFGSAEGCCTLRLALEAKQLDIAGVKAHSEGLTIQSRTFPAYESSDGLPTLYTNQGFTIYVEFFYGELPPDFATTRTNIPES
jgi:hypothetical protein